MSQLLKLYPNYNDGTDTKTKIRAFQFAVRDNALETFLAEDVEAFFQHWMRTETKMPMPANALRFCKDRMTHRKAMDKSAHGGPRIGGPAAKIVPWYGMEYDEIMGGEHGAALEEHLVKLRKSRGADATKDYILYLKNHVKRKLTNAG